jgi:putative endonuclease
MAPDSNQLRRRVVTIAVPLVAAVVLPSRAMTSARTQLGRRVEELVADSLERGGAAIVARNARASEVRGEIDLIVADRGELVFVEVKARTEGGRLGPERPALAVTRSKQAKLRSLARAWLADRSGELPRHRGLRFDVVGVTVDAGGRVVDWEHLRGAF